MTRLINCKDTEQWIWMTGWAAEASHSRPLAQEPMQRDEPVSVGGNCRVHILAPGQVGNSAKKLLQLGGRESRVPVLRDREEVLITLASRSIGQSVSSQWVAGGYCFFVCVTYLG